MVLRPGSTTSNDGLMIQEASEAGARSAGRSPTAREHSERPVASWSSEGTFTTGHGASDDQEGYEEQFAVPDAAPDEGAAKGRDVSRGPTGRKPAKADDQQQPTAKAAAKRKSPKRRKKKKLCAPDSADGPPVKARGDDTRNQFTAAEMRYMLAGVELIRLLEHDPILRFIKPNAIKFTGPFRVPDYDMLTNVTRAAGRHSNDHTTLKPCHFITQLSRRTHAQNDLYRQLPASTGHHIALASPTDHHACFKTIAGPKTSRDLTPPSTVLSSARLDPPRNQPVAAVVYTPPTYRGAKRVISFCARVASASWHHVPKPHCVAGLLAQPNTSRHTATIVPAVPCQQRSVPLPDLPADSAVGFEPGGVWKSSVEKWSLTKRTGVWERWL
ncbi:hypothetical protein PHYSODRAFT_342754 [Phytophthora sojae]|uniref:Uncharacterized protein n=1 Tax=Phytophthora sojae (strain P6497) TaxID=1094619 RepID=G5AHI7_PHYSP|nr:hypothetical protein PHYSODRAFT_342754 [Phytophthora sojae]EGZ05029.1 hypothetical protein PHYSODRAFT_342754 [Phytophthora sojae]|eukprot:XP_009539538.1 hypothetical protein PHYSODRAFT_342754 [Phytophthora sojae]